MSDATKKGELALRDKAALHQQRRLKQATLFTHKDSADLLPLDGLKRLGTSKDLQPHSIVQRRLMEGGASGRLRGEARDAAAASLARSPLAVSKEGGGGGEGPDSENTADSSPEESEHSLRSEEEEEQEEERDGEEAVAKGAETEEETPSRSPPTLAALVVWCKCCTADVRASIDTGCQHNHISSSCCRRLGLVPEQDSGEPPSRTVRGLELQLGSQRVQCSAYVKDDEQSELCLGLETLLELKCCLDLSGRVLRLEGSGEELAFLVPGTGNVRCRHDTNKNL